MTFIDPKTVPVRKLNNGDTMPAIGMGTFGSDRFTPEEVSAAVAGAIRCGYRMFDCAACYGNEDLIGRVFREAFDEGAVKREELYVTTKVWNDMHSPENVEKSCKKSIEDLQIDYVDLFFIHWPFRNYHSPGCSVDARNPDSHPFRAEEFMETWRACEALVEKGLVRHIGMSNMTIPKLEAVLKLCKIKPSAIEMEIHPAFQQTELFEYMMKHGIQPVAFCPLGSPQRPERDMTEEDIADMQLPEIQSIAKAHGVHPALICIKWHVQRGEVPIPFSIHEMEYAGNLKAVTEDPLTEEEMKIMNSLDKNNRLIKGHVFLWEGARGWEDLWDLDGKITK